MAKHNEIVKKLGIEIPEEIYDDESGELIPCDVEKVQRALYLVSRVQNNIVILAEGIAEFFNGKYYLYLGLSKAEAASVCFGMSPSSIAQFERIARTFGERLSEFASLGITRLDSISSLPEDQKNELLSSKKITLKDGTVLTYEELAGMKVKELETTIKALRKEKSNLTVRLNEIETSHEREINQLKSEITNLDRLSNIPPEEKEFHRKITRRSEAQNKIKEATAGMYDAFMKLYQIEIDPSNGEIVTAGVEAFITDTAKRLLALESEYGAVLGNYREGIQKLARVK